MNKISKRKDGRYQIKKQINGFKIDIIDKNKQNLITKYRAKISAYKQATKDIITFNETKTKVKILKEWLWEWLDKYKRPFIKPLSAKNIESYFKFIETQPIAKKDINKLTSEILQDFVNSIPYSRNKELIILYLRAALKKYLKKDLFLDVVLEKKYNVVRKPFTYKEQKTIWNNLNKFKYKELIIFYLFTGIRKNELPNNFNNNLIKENYLFKIECEKRKEKNIIYKYIDLSKKMFNFIEENKNKFLIKTDILYRAFKNFLETLNIKGSLHTLRHTFASNYYTLGINLKLLSSWLGHTKTDTTIEHYVAIDRTINKENLLELYGNFLFKL